MSVHTPCADGGRHISISKAVDIAIMLRVLTFGACTPWPAEAMHRGAHTLGTRLSLTGFYYTLSHCHAQDIPHLFVNGVEGRAWKDDYATSVSTCVLFQVGAKNSLHSTIADVAGRKIAALISRG